MYKFLLCLVSLVVLVAACSPAPAATATLPPTAIQAAAEPEVSAVVAAFGARLKNVSLLAPDAAEQIEAQYAGLVSDELIAAWQADPTQAPGRLTSSPWPDRIEVNAIEQVSA